MKDLLLHEALPRHSEAARQPLSPERSRRVINPLTIASRLRAARIAANQTQQDLAGDTFSKSYISAIERGKMTPSFKALGILAERLGTTSSFLLGEDPIEPPAPPPSETPTEEASEDTLQSEAREAILQGRYEEGLTLCREIGQLELLGWAHEQYSHFLAAQRRYQEAYEHLCLAQATPGA